MYRDISVPEGGRGPNTGDTVRVHYTGRLEDGTVFDSSVERGEPISFELGAGRVIRGWDEGVAGMVVGAKRQLVIPSHLGYGARQILWSEPRTLSLSLSLTLSLTLTLTLTLSLTRCPRSTAGHPAERAAAWSKCRLGSAPIRLLCFLSTPKKRPSHRAPSHCYGASSYPRI